MSSQAQSARHDLNKFIIAWNEDNYKKNVQDVPAFCKGFEAAPHEWTCHLMHGIVLIIVCRQVFSVLQLLSKSKEIKITNSQQYASGLE